MRLIQVSTLFGNKPGYDFIKKKKSITITNPPNIILSRYLNGYPAINDINKTEQKRIAAVGKLDGKIKKTIINTGIQKRKNELLKVGVL